MGTGSRISGFRGMVVEYLGWVPGWEAVAEYLEIVPRTVGGLSRFQPVPRPVGGSVQAGSRRGAIKRVGGREQRLVPPYCRVKAAEHHTARFVSLSVAPYSQAQTWFSNRKVTAKSCGHFAWAWYQDTRISVHKTRISVQSRGQPYANVRIIAPGIVVIAFDSAYHVLVQNVHVLLFVAHDRVCTQPRISFKTIPRNPVSGSAAVNAEKSLSARRLEADSRSQYRTSRSRRVGRRHDTLRNKIQETAFL
eukprot:3941275-Rhodomonas_salina.1